MTGGSAIEARLRALFDSRGYVAPDRLIRRVALARRTNKPLLLEGPPGVGKTELAGVLADGWESEYVRVQCYPGLGPEEALYEWHYAKQLLAIRSRRSGVEKATGRSIPPVFDQSFLLERPLLRALRATSESRSSSPPENGGPPVVLIDEIDRADEAFEALLLEVLSEFQVSIPELGVIAAETPPFVVLTSNRTRALSDALRRRCLFCYLPVPPARTRIELVNRRLPALDSGFDLESDRDPRYDRVPEAVPNVAEELVTFSDRLLAAGTTVPADSVLAAGEALSALDRLDRTHVRAALRATLVSRSEDIDSFEALFPVLWSRLAGGEQPYPAPDRAPHAPSRPESSDAPDRKGITEQQPGTDRAVSIGVGDGEAPNPDNAGPGTRYSHAGSGHQLRESLDGSTDATAIDSAVAAFTRAVASLPGRRFETRTNGTIDARRALRGALSNGGVPIDLPECSPASDRATGIVLVDVSGSVLDAFDPGVLVSVLRAIRAAWFDTPVLFFDTTLREVSDALDEPTLEATIDALSAAGIEWGGGTRLAEALSTFEAEHRRALDRRGTLLLISDGIVGGNVGLLADAMASLARRAETTLWLNPLATDPDWAPATRGMRAALPFIDGLYGFAEPADLEGIANTLDRHGPSRRGWTIPAER